MISIVIPAYNEEKFFPDCLGSLRNQDYTGEYEIIVADNGSTDDTAKIARSFNARVISCPEKKDVCYARQRGAAAARGEIIIQADADTVYPSHWLSRIAEQFSSPEVVAVAGRFIYRDPPSWAKLEYYFRNYLNRLTNAIFGRPVFVSGATLAFRREVFLRVNGYEGLTYAPDQYGISGRLAKMGKIVYDKELCILTSSRSVNKTFLFVAMEAFANFARWLAFMCGCCPGLFRGAVVKPRLRRYGARLLPVLTLFAFFVVYGYFIPSSPVFGKVYSKVKTQQEVIALTFDDGPNEPYTPQILDILARYDVKATFFVIGKNVELYPETAKRIVAEGHVIGNHSYSHQANHALIDYSSRDLLLAQFAIFGVVGLMPCLYRPPHGRKSPWELQNAKKEGLTVVMWSVSIGELNNKSAVSLAGKIVSKAKPGGIILLHDGYGTAHNTPQSDKTLTVKVLPQIIEQLQSKGYRFVTILELLNVPAYNN